jgi:hypothetical protein
MGGSFIRKKYCGLTINVSKVRLYFQIAKFFLKM